MKKDMENLSIRHGFPNTENEITSSLLQEEEREKQRCAMLLKQRLGISFITM